MARLPGRGGKDGWMEQGGGDEGQNKGENMRNRMEVNTDEKWGQGEPSEDTEDQRLRHGGNIISPCSV